MMTQTIQKTATTPPPTSKSGEFSFGSVLRRPETGAFLGLLFVFVFFTIFGGINFLAPTGAASYLKVAANLGIVALPIGLLMIAGELDISIGSMIPAGAMTVAIISGYFGAPIIVGMAASLAFGVVVGLINGVLVVRTAVPSLIVTLGTLFAVQGLVLGLSVLLTGRPASPSMRRAGRSSCSAASSAGRIRSRSSGGSSSPRSTLSSCISAPTATGSSPWAATR